MIYVGWFLAAIIMVLALADSYVAVYRRGVRRGYKTRQPAKVVIYLDENGRPYGSVGSSWVIVEYRTAKNFGGLVSDAAETAKEGGAE